MILDGRKEDEYVASTMRLYNLTTQTMFSPLDNRNATRKAEASRHPSYPSGDERMVDVYITP